MSKKRTTILIAGTFDNFHVGHQFLCWQAYNEVESRGKDSLLTIIIARDKTVERIKKHKPKNEEPVRLRRLKQEFEHFDGVKIRLGRQDADFWKTVQEVNPQKILLGYDQKFDNGAFGKIFPDILVERCPAYAPGVF